MAQGNSPTWRHDAVAAVLILGVLALSLWRAGTIGPTVDEPFHVVRGLAWWWEDSTRLSYAHPPLANLLQAVPAVLTAEPLDLSRLPGWDVSDHATMAEHLFLTQYEAVRPLMMMGRLANTALMVLFALTLYLWTSRRLGARIGLLTLALVGFNPTVLAHAQLFTTDLPVTFAIFGVTATFIDYLDPRRPHAWRKGVNLVLFALAMAAALCTKFTAVALIPVLAVVGVTWAGQGWGRFSGARPAGSAAPGLPSQPGLGWRFLQVGGEMLFVAVVCLVAIAAIYRFEMLFLSPAEMLALPEPQCHLTDDSNDQFLESRWLINALPRDLPLPVPYTWFFGLEMVRFHGSRGHGSWMAGFTYGWGNPAYFPVMLLIKTPPAVLLGVLLAAIQGVRRGRPPGATVGVILAVAGFLFFLLIGSQLNIGVRHALPVVPLLGIVAAIALLRAFHGAWQRWGRVGLLAALALVLSVPAASIWNAGRYLPYFNIGRLGYQISIVGEDWGQDSIHLARAIDELDMRPVRYVTYGIASWPEVRHQGAEPIKARCGQRGPRFGWVVAHRALVQRWPECVPGAGDRPPDRIISENLFAWDLDSTNKDDGR